MKLSHAILILFKRWMEKQISWSTGSRTGEICLFLKPVQSSISYTNPDFPPGHVKEMYGTSGNFLQ